MANIKISELSPLVTVQDADVLPIVDNAITKKVTAAILRSYTQGNSVLLTGAQTVAGIKTFTSQLASTVATGTAPFSVLSTTKVTNLNADLLDGLSSADFQAPLSGTGIVKSTAGTISYLTDNSTNWNTAFNDKINSAAVTGSGTNTLTLTQQDAGTITATWVNGTLIREIRNNTGATLTKGTIVYISGATGNKPTVSKAIATGDSTSAQTFGFVQENILNNANGYVVIIGDLTGVDTSAFAEGAQLYLSATTAGTFTDVKQYAPNHLVYVGIVTRAHPTLGQIEVNIQNGYELDELHNVAAQNPSNGDILQFVTSTGLWTKVAGTTTNISEGTNLYFTNARSRSAISLTTTGTSGAATYNSTTGVLNVPNYADTDTGITSLNGLTALTQTFAVGTSGTDFGISSATSTHTFNLPTASATNRGALSSADWTTFNNKQNALTNPITGTGTTNYLPKFTGASALGNSIVSEGSGIINVAGNVRTNNTNGILTLSNGNTSGGNKIQSWNAASNADGYLAFEGYNIEYGRFDASGQLGIGITSPLVKLQSNISTSGLPVTSGTTQTNGALRLSSNATTGILDFGINGANNWIQSTDAGDLSQGYNLLLNPRGGSVGIGTTSPASILETIGQVTINAASSGAGIGKLQLKGAKSDGDGFNLSFDNSTNIASINLFYNGAFTFGNANTERMRIAPTSGNLLLNTTTDAGYKLDVNGTARVSGAFTVSTGRTGLFSGDNFSLGLAQTVGQANYFYLGTNSSGDLLMSDTSGSAKLTITQAGAATFSSSVTAKGDLFIWGGNAAQSGFITGNSGGGGLYIGATGTNQNIRLVPSGTGITQATTNLDVLGSISIANPVAAAVAVASTHKVTIVIGGVTYYLLATNV